MFFLGTVFIGIEQIRLFLYFGRTYLYGLIQL